MYRIKIRLKLLLLTMLLVTGCSHSPTITLQPKPNPSQTESDPWLLGSPTSDSPTPALLWNGLIGLRLGRAANGFGPDGQPLGFFMIDEYQPSDEEKILTMPNPILVTWSVGNKIYDGDKSKQYDFIKSGGTPLSPTGDVSGYRQVLDMHSGILTTSWTQQTPDAGKVQFQCLTAIHPTQRAIAQQWTIQLEKPTTFSVKSLDYSGPNDEQDFIGGDTNQNVILSASKKRVVTLQTALSCADAGANASVGGFRVQEGTALPGKPIVFERVLSFSPHSPTTLPEFSEKNVSLLKNLAPQPLNFAQVARASQEIWKERWTTDIQIDGPAEDQKAVRSFMFYLQSAIAAPKTLQEAHSISPFGLSDPMYFGHIFWDADVWVLPATDLLFPDQAKSIPGYRLATAAQAESNFDEWLLPSSPNRNSAWFLSPAQGIKYPWESSVTGKETVPGQSKLEEHVTGSVAWSLTQAADLGLAPKKDVDHIAVLADTFYRLKSVHGIPLEIQQNQTHEPMQIRNVMSPDENHVGDNDLYTNLLANWLSVGRKWPSSQTPLPFKIPRDKDGLITYDGDLGMGYKQAAAVLSIYPLQFPEAESHAVQMLNRFEPHVIKSGPAMSDSIHAIIHARFDNPPSYRAYEDWIKSWKPFTSNRFLLFSEKRNKEQTYFTTGAAGALQTVLYGFLGFRIDSQQQPDSLWHTSLMGNTMLSIKPNLPPLWKSVKIENLSVLGTHYSFRITHQGLQVLPGGK